MILIVLIGTLSACGFHLQGTLSTPDEMQRTYIDTDDKHSLFYRELRRELLASGIELVESPSGATATFQISYDDTGQRVLSVSARNVPTEYEVYYTIEYGATSGKKTLLETQDLTLTRDYTYDATLVLGKAREEQIMREALVDDLVRIVLKQLSTL